MRNLLDLDTKQDAPFIARQEERRKRRQPDQIYDITAWSLPLMYDVEVVTSATAIGSRTTMVPAAYDAAPPARTVAAGTVGYLVPWGVAGAALTAEAVSQGLRVHSVGGAFTLGGRAYPLGTALVRTAGNPADLPTRLAALSTKHGAEVVSIDSTYVESGTSLGSNDVGFVKAPRVLLAWDLPTSTLSAGWTRYVLERRYGQKTTTVRTASLSRVNFADFDVVVLPSGNYADQIGSAVLVRLKDWIRQGGTLVTLAEATRWAATSAAGLLDTNALLKDGKPDVPPPSPAAATGASSTPDFDKAIQPDRERPDAQPGALLRATVDTDHWLSAGQDAETQVVIEGARVFAPLKLNAGRNVVYYHPKETLVASGLIWPEGQELLVRKAYLMHQPMGQGHIIGFAEDANYRAYTEATMLLFMNAVLLGPAY